MSSQGQDWGLLYKKAQGMMWNEKQVRLDIMDGVIIHVNITPIVLSIIFYISFLDDVYLVIALGNCLFNWTAYKQTGKTSHKLWLWDYF